MSLEPYMEPLGRSKVMDGTPTIEKSVGNEWKKEKKKEGMRENFLTDCAGVEPMIIP